MSKHIRLAVSFDKEQDEFFIEDPNKKALSDQTQDTLSKAAEEKNQLQEYAMDKISAARIAS